MNQFKQLLAKLQISNTDQKNKLLSVLLLPVISVVVAIMLAIFVIVPQLFNYLKTRSTLDETYSHIAELESKSRVLESIPLDNYQSGFDIVLKALPVERDYIFAATQLQLIASSAGVKLSAINFLDLGSAEAYQIKVDADGSLDAVKDFLKQIDNSARVMKVASISLSTDKDNLYRSNLSINAVLQPLVKRQPIDQAAGQLSDQDQAMLANLSQTLGSVTTALSQSSAIGSGRPDPFQ